KLLILAILWEIALITILTSIPATREALHIIPPTLGDAAWILLGALVTFVSMETTKQFKIGKP
ncbi:MAG: hypothetical protein QW668_04890, partial [Nitrososphaerota archaeon]